MYLSLKHIGGNGRWPVDGVAEKKKKVTHRKNTTTELAVTTMLTVPGSACRRQAPLLLHPQGLVRRVHDSPHLHERKKSKAQGWDEQSGAG